MKKILTVLLVVLFVLAGCQAKETSVLEKYELENYSTQELVDYLEHDKQIAQVLSAQLFPNEIKLSDGNEDQTISTKGELFYLSIAPFVNTTHPCTYHIPTGCQGELIGETFNVKVIGKDGTVYFNDTLTTAHNGFMGMWIPRNIEATVYVENSLGKASELITTYDDSLTCLTTMHLQ